MKIEKNIKENLSREDLIELLNKQEQTIKSLEQNENKYESLFEDSLDGIYKSTLEGAFLDVNTALVNMLGYNTKEELLAIDINTQLYFNSKERKSVLDNINDLEIQRYCFQKKDGSTIWVEDYGKIETNEKGEFLYYKGIIRNVTDFKREIDIKKILLRIYQKGYDVESFEELNRFILSQLSSLLDVSNAYIAFYNEKKETINIPFISGEVSEREFPVGKSMTGYLMRGKVPLLVKAEKYRALIDSGEINLLGVFPKVWMGAPLIIDSKVIGAIVIQSYTDENAYNQQDLDLLEFVSTYISSEILRNRKKFELRKFSLAVEQSANTIVITNTEGEIEYVNAKFTEITGYTKEEIIGINPRILNSGNQDKAYFRNMWETISSGKEWLGEFQNISKSGKLFWERAAITSIKNSDGVITNYMAVKEEITLQKETEEKLKKATNEIIFAKEVLRKVLDNIPIKVFWKDLDSKFLGVNATSLKEMNIDDENEVIGKSDFDFHNKKWAQKYKNDELAIMKSGVPKLNYIETQIKNGKELSYISNKLPFFDENNNVIGIIGTSEDITEKLDYENKLKQVTNEVTLAKEVLRNVFDNIPIKVFWKDLDSKYLGCNEAYLKEKSFLYEKDVIGKSDFDLHKYEDAIKYREDEVEIMQSGKPKLNYQESSFFTGKERWFLANKLPFFDENNNVIGIIGTSEDITEKLDYENKLKQVTNEVTLAKEVLRKVLDNIPVKVFWKNKELKFLGCNDAFLKDNLFKNEEEIIGKSDFDFNNKKDAETYRKDDLAVMLSGKPKLNFQHSNIKNGKRRWITTSKLPFFDENNNVIGIIGTSEDITERRENEVKLKKATEEAISANLSKSTFLSNMSHEIRTPMNAILGYSQLLQEDDNLTKPQQDNLKTINTSGEHLLSLINDILDMSKIEAGRVTLNLLAFNFLELLKEIQQLFIIKASQKKLQLLLNIDKNVPKSILGDESKIKQVIINLVGNAIKFTTTGFVEIFVSKITDKKLQVSIKDSGKGILKEEHELVFKPFEQALGSSKFREGTGLGLAISKKFSNLMNGDIALESEFGKGSIFSFSFEFEEGIEAPLREDLEGLKVIGLSEKSKDIKIAIVDDRFENRDILFQKLNPLGFEIKMAENGQEAVDLYKNWKPDIILMDVVMPIMNGVEATRKILEIAGEHKVKIFVVSASALESEQKEIMDLGAAVFIKKPVIFNMLLSEMEHKGGVEFIYSAEKIKKKKSQIKITPANVPLHIKHKMVIAAEEGDFVLLQNLLEDLETETNNKFEFLENCINEMEFEEVINWFES